MGGGDAAGIADPAQAERPTHRMVLVAMIASFASRVAVRARRRARAPALACGLAIATLASQITAAAQGLPTIEPERIGISSQRLERVSHAIRADIAAGTIPGAVMLIARHGKLAYFHAFGMRDQRANAPMQTDAILRLGSMSKPITIAAAMMLVEEGRLSLNDPIAKYLPQFANMRVGIERRDARTGRAMLDEVPAVREITVEDLMRHTSGLSYEALGPGPKVKEMYREAGIPSRDQSAAEMVDKLARLPLMYQPQTVWEYSRGVDVLGRILELLSGMPLSELLARRVLAPLRMQDTAFWVPPEKRDRVADVLPTPPEGRRLLLDVSKQPKFEGGGGGLVSTAGDYARFLQMLLNGGELDDVRLLSPKSVALMTSNRLGSQVVTKGWSYYPGPGYGFGLGFAVRLTPGVSAQIGSVGDYFVEGLYGTFAFADPKEGLLAVFMIALAR